MYGRIVRHSNGKSQSLETVHHRLRVLAPERASQDNGIARESRENQGAIGQALRARNYDGCIGPTVDWNNFDERRQHGVVTIAQCSLLPQLVSVTSIAKNSEKALHRLLVVRGFGQSSYSIGSMTAVKAIGMIGVSFRSAATTPSA